MRSAALKIRLLIPIGLFIIGLVSHDARAHDGLMHVEGKTLFPIGFYNFPEDEARATHMAESGVNLVRCGNADALDRAQRLGMYGWHTLPMHTALDDAGRTRIKEMATHPALAIWEGPDELVWNFTAFSGLFRDGTHEIKDAWWAQTPNAVAHAKARAAEIMPNIHDWVAAIREIDGDSRPVWFNEAYKSDTEYVRQYLDVVDITGCDLYPVKSMGRPIANVADYTERFNLVGEGKPVWMVLQAFSWHEVKTDKDLPEAYPTFDESRFMAWDAIAHGATAILYWGSRYTKNDAFLESIFAVTRELAALQTLLVAPRVQGTSLRLIEAPTLEPIRGVAYSARVNQSGGLVVLVNEDNRAHMGVEVNGLAPLEDKTLHQLYGDESLVVRDGRVLTRLLPHEVKVFTTDRSLVAERLAGRNFGRE